MKFAIFFKNSFYLFAAFAIFLLFIMLSGEFRQVVSAAWVGLFLAYLNFLIGAAILSWSTGRSDKDFYGSFFGGMILRFMLLFLLLWVLIKFLHLDLLVLTGSLLICYFAFLGLEIWLIHRFSISKGTPP